MNRVLALDISTKTGWAILGRDDGTIKLEVYGLLALDKPVSKMGFDYPWNFVVGAEKMGLLIGDRASDHVVDAVIIEETNLGRQRYSQKILEFIHYATLQQLFQLDYSVKYISTSVWRKHLGVRTSKEQRKQNAKLSKAKSAAKKAGVPLDKKALGIKGRITTKHVAVAWANDRYGLELIQKDNDIADAIAVGTAALTGAEFCTGNER